MSSSPRAREYSFEEALSVQSDKLKELREAIDGSKELSKMLGGIVRFRLVVDTNIIIGDILWLVAERTKPNAKTQLMETIEAATIDLFAPPRLLDEVEEKLVLLAEDKGLDLQEMQAHWATYRAKITIAEPDNERVLIARQGVDPDDAEFLALAETIAAAGIFSKDRDIAQMGGNQISVECITHLRDFSRATAVELNIKINGVRFAVFGVAAAKRLFVGIEALIDGVKKAPDWVKVALIAGGLFIAFNPNARAGAIRALKYLLAGIKEATPVAISGIYEAAALAAKQQTTARLKLEKAMEELTGELPDSLALSSGTKITGTTS
jgi:predicted nucleic acid-binding protein